jgi:hypothetical protein
VRAKETIKFINEAGETVKTLKRVLITAPCGAEYFRYKGREHEIDSYDDEDGSYVVRVMDHNRDYWED